MHSQSIEYPHSLPISPTEVKPVESATPSDKTSEKESESKARLQLLRSIYAESDCV